LEISSDGFTESGNAASAAVAVVAGGNGVADGVDHRSRWVKVGFAKLKVNDGASLAFELLGAGIDSKSALAIEL